MNKQIDQLVKELLEACCLQISETAIREIIDEVYEIGFKDGKESE